MGKNETGLELKAMMQKKILTALMGCQRRSAKAPKQMKQKKQSHINTYKNENGAKCLICYFRMPKLNYST